MINETATIVMKKKTVEIRLEEYAKASSCKDLWICGAV
jgi:hypothetical protein